MEEKDKEYLEFGFEIADAIAEHYSELVAKGIHIDVTAYGEWVLKNYFSKKITAEGTKSVKMSEIKPKEDDLSEATDKQKDYIKSLIGRANELHLNTDVIGIFKAATGSTDVKTADLTKQQASLIIEELKDLLQ